MFETYATKLGIHSPRAVRKAQELLQKIEIRVGVSTLNIPSSCLHVICLELAAGLQSISIDRATSIKLSGMGTKSGYVSTYKTVESLLDLTMNQSVRDLTVQFGCTQMKDLAEKILNRYTEEHHHQSHSGVDFTSAMFKCAAISAACKKSKVKVERTKLYEMSAVKRNVFDNLTTEMERLADKIMQATKPKENKKGSDPLMDRVYANMQEYDSSAANNQSEAPAVDFDEWKRRILEQAT